ncbi:MAG: TenA family protein [Ardenticatenaceae bacterium]|nr:TenA family protein [Ardenticatenaceae bacterium]
MTLSQTLWQANQDVARACLEHPFIRGIAAGTLPRSRFAHYVGQDAFFLEAFARAYSLAAAKAPDWEGFAAFHALAGGVLDELRLHQGYAAEWGVDLRTVEPGRATRHYTDFLFATAWRSEAGLTAVAMAPCMRLYAFLGHELARQGLSSHPYAGWIRTYSSLEFEQLAGQLEHLVDRYANDASLAGSTYRYAMVCERDFFQAAWDER